MSHVHTIVYVLRTCLMTCMHIRTYVYACIQTYVHTERAREREKRKKRGPSQSLKINAKHLLPLLTVQRIQLQLLRQDLTHFCVSCVRSRSRAQVSACVVRACMCVCACACVCARAQAYVRAGVWHDFVSVCLRTRRGVHECTTQTRARAHTHTHTPERAGRFSRFFTRSYLPPPFTVSGTCEGERVHVFA
jgi:hypothetical protein